MENGKSKRRQRCEGRTDGRKEGRKGGRRYLRYMDALTWRVTIWQRSILCWLWVCGGCAVAVGRTINKLATFAASNSTICVVRHPFCCCVDVVTIAIITAIAVAVAGVARPDVDDDVGSVASLKRIRIVAEWWDHDTDTCKRAGRIICCADGMHNLRIVLPGIYPARIRKFSYVKVPLPVIAKDRPPPPRGDWAAVSPCRR